MDILGHTLRFYTFSDWFTVRFVVSMLTCWANKHIHDTFIFFRLDVENCLLIK